MTQRLRIQPAEVHRSAVISHVTQNCQAYAWAKGILGALRARDYLALVKKAKLIDESLINGSYLDDLAGTAVQPVAYWKHASQLTAMILKYPYSPSEIPGLNPNQAALDLLDKEERRNRRMNTILRGHISRGGLERKHPAFSHMRAFIRKVIGEKPNIQRILESCDFSSGASLGVHGQATHLGAKMLTEPLTVTPTCLKYFAMAVWKNEQLLDHFLRRAHQACGPVPPVICYDFDVLLAYLESIASYESTDKISCVTKKYDMSRTIGIGPTANLVVQKGIDLEMRKMLAQYGMILDDQERNQCWAYLGSLTTGTNPMSTLDVKGASNGVLVQLVKGLLPSEWFSFLDETRSPARLMPDGSVRRYELFCAMGNGFCFPLETLIFGSICYAAYKLCNRHPEFRVYGDDIIVRQDVALSVIEILRECGFRTNIDKSFVFGPFRESCGANWYEGRLVTPVYWRKRITSRSELHAIHNAHEGDEHLQSVLRRFDPTLPFTVPNTPQYSNITEEAFRVPHELCMASSGTIWRRDTQSWRYRILQATPVCDETYTGDTAVLEGAIPGEKQADFHRVESARHIACLRGSTYADAFLLRKSVRYVVQEPHPSKDEGNIKPPKNKWWLSDTLRANHERPAYGTRMPERALVRNANSEAAPERRETASYQQYGYCWPEAMDG